MTASPEALHELAAAAGADLSLGLGVASHGGLRGGGGGGGEHEHEHEHEHVPAVSGALQVFVTMGGVPIAGSPFAPALRLVQPPERATLPLDTPGLHAAAGFGFAPPPHPAELDPQFAAALAAAAAYPPEMTARPEGYDGYEGYDMMPPPPEGGGGAPPPPPLPPAGGLGPDPERVRAALEVRQREHLSPERERRRARIHPTAPRTVSVDSDPTRA